MLGFLCKPDSYCSTDKWINLVKTVGNCHEKQGNQLVSNWNELKEATESLDVKSKWEEIKVKR